MLYLVFTSRFSNLDLLERSTYLGHAPQPHSSCFSNAAAARGGLFEPCRAKAAKGKAGKGKGGRRPPLIGSGCGTPSTQSQQENAVRGVYNCHRRRHRHAAWQHLHVCIYTGMCRPTRRNLAAIVGLDGSRLGDRVPNHLAQRHAMNAGVGVRETGAGRERSGVVGRRGAGIAPSHGQHCSRGL